MILYFQFSHKIELEPHFLYFCAGKSLYRSPSTRGEESPGNKGHCVS